MTEYRHVSFDFLNEPAQVPQVRLFGSCAKAEKFAKRFGVSIRPIPFKEWEYQLLRASTDPKTRPKGLAYIVTYPCGAEECAEGRNHDLQ